MSVLIFPNTLIEIDILNKIIPEKISKIIIYEHPAYFTRLKTFSKSKLLFHRMSMRSYFYYLKKNRVNVEYVEFYQAFPKFIKYAIDSIDNHVRDQLIKHNIIILDNPCFIIPRQELINFYKKTSKTRFMSFYNNLFKEYVKIPIENLDYLNRQAIPKNFDLKQLPKPRKYNGGYPNLMKESIDYIEKYFKNNPGDYPPVNYYPLSSAEAKSHFLNFLKYINPWGEYEDAILPESIFVFHSNMSSSLNCGFILPHYIIDKVQKLYGKKGVRLASYEAHLRQYGWREMNRYIYENKELMNEIVETNYFNIHNKVDKSWYIINKPILKSYDFINNEKDKFLLYGYAHHICRLMCFGSLMLLLEISPTEGFRWFYSLGVDSYEWVMIYNCYAMNWHSGGSKYFSKPYVNSSSYITRMSGSRIKRNQEMDLLYQKFVKKHKNKLLTRK